MDTMGETVTGATDPLERNPVGRPTTTTSSPPIHAPSSSGPITVTSCPSLRKARDRPNTWPWTPPGRDSEYGDSMPIFMPAPASYAVTGPVRLIEVPLLGSAPYVPLERGGDLLGQPGDVGPQRPGSCRIERCPHHTSVPSARTGV